ncbi:hypothetical protein QCA50_004107 [Cerrena zonata]|uniref:F-box domain-containing protein n=1 Tax=Cerrena zonata TaxID=2478898 RepID=A0AAW0GII6_9APHY
MCLDLLEKHNACQRLTAVALNRTYAPAGSRYVEADKRQASLSAPNLRELTLAYDWPREESIGNQKRRRPLPFSLGELPHLSSFIASRAPFSDIRTFFRPTITHLSLLHLFERIPTDQFLSALKSMPLLEVLELHTALSPFDGRHIRPHHFQHLRRLAFADCMATLADYLTSLVFHASSLESIEISCEPLQCNTPQDGPMLPHRLRSIVGRLRGLLREPMRSMHIHNKESHNSPLEIAGWSTSDVPSSTIRPLLELKIAERNGRHDVLELIIVALSEMEVENVRTLTYGFLDVPKDPIRRVRIPLPLYLEEYGMVYSRFIQTEVITIDLGLAPRLRDAMMMRFPLDWQEIRQRLVHWFEYLDELPETGLPEEGQENRKFLFPAIKTVIVQWKQSFSRDQGTTMEHLRKQFAEASAFRGQEIEILSNVLPASSTMNNFVFFG